MNGEKQIMQNNYLENKNVGGYFSIGKISSRVLSLLQSSFIYFLFILTIQLIQVQSSFAQKAAARYEIDAKRLDLSPTDKDALPRGREFIRLDSTYYVGWMYQGLFYNDRSSDIAGYERSLPLMRKAFLLLEKDYGLMLKTLLNDPMVFMQNRNRLIDYLSLASKLRETYEYTDKPDSAMWVLNQIEKKNFRKDFFNVAGSKAWLIHRNRFYTRAKYSFLGNSVDENEQLALKACYTGFAKIKKNMAMNNLWFGEGQAVQDRNAIYHYLALIHCYLKNYDSSEYYYKQMTAAGFVSNNNYGSMKSETGEFAKAMELYKKDQYRNAGEKFLMEPFYYLPILSIYSGDTKQAMSTAKEAIQYSNSSPGFGWYNIALARSYLYDGQLDSAIKTIDKAAAFREIHIGTTLTQPQYEFTIGLLKLVWFNKKIAQLKFFDKGWWYHPGSLYDITALQANKYTHEYVLATQLSQNPERARIIYDLFCGESTVGYDEIWYLMKRFSPKYFMRMMAQYTTTDPRKNIKRYFELYDARLEWENGKKSTAEKSMEKILSSTKLDTAREKLFLARLYEGLALAYNDDNNKAKATDFTNALYQEYPQLVPFSGMAIPMKLQIIGANDAVTKEVVEELKNCNIAWQESGNIPVAVVNFQKKGIKYDVTINVTSADKKKMVTNERFLFMQPKGAGKEAAMRIFGSSGAREIEPPPPPAAKK